MYDLEELQILVQEKFKEILDDEGFIKNNITMDDVTMETNLTDDLGVNSLDKLALSWNLENEFQIPISDEEWGNVETVGDAVNCILESKTLKPKGDDASSTRSNNSQGNLMYSLEEHQKFIKNKFKFILDERGFDNNGNDITMETFLKDDLGLESLDTLVIQQKCDKEFNISILDQDWESVQTVKDAVNCIIKSEKLKLKLG